MKTALVIMAAGIGSRFGKGIKQLTPVGPSGEIIMDYSIYDAKRAGFDKVYFIIREDIKEEFDEIIGRRIRNVMDVDYVYQKIDDLPEGYSLPKGRTKPWGTAQAVLALRGKVAEPMLVINADDYYGKEGFTKLHDYLVSTMNQSATVFDMCMAGFIVKNTLSENGGVTRGVCLVDENMQLLDVTETFELGYQGETLIGTRKDRDEPYEIQVDPESFVSMNMWGFAPSFLDEIAKGFPRFLDSLDEGDIKSEYLLPTVIDEFIKTGKATVKVLPTNDKWFGVTYQEDKDTVIAAIKKLVDEGVYPAKLY